MTATFVYEIGISWTTLRETGELLTKRSSLSLSIFNPDAIETHDKTITIRTVTGKKVGETWDAACAIDIAEIPEIKQIKADYPTTHYFVFGNWIRVK